MNFNKKIIQLHELDNIVVAIDYIPMASEIYLNEQSIKTVQDVPMGFKIACRSIKKGDKILKYGLSIGSASQNIQIGELIHTHNMKSDYIKSFTENE